MVGPMDVAQEGLRAIGQTVCSTDDFLNAVVLYNMVGAGVVFAGVTSCAWLRSFWGNHSREWRKTRAMECEYPGCCLLGDFERMGRPDRK